jgi:hypothetical protein
VKIYAKNIVDRGIRLAKIRQLEYAAAEYMDKLLSEFDFPTQVMLSIGNTKGLLDLSKEFETLHGSIEVCASFTTLSGQKIKIDLFVPAIRGSVIAPSIMRINGTKKVFSKEAVENFIKRLESTLPKIMKYPQPSMECIRIQTVKPGMFTAPKDPILFDYGTG